MYQLRYRQTCTVMRGPPPRYTCSSDAQPKCPWALDTTLPHNLGEVPLFHDPPAPFVECIQEKCFLVPKRALICGKAWKTKGHKEMQLADLLVHYMYTTCRPRSTAAGIADWRDASEADASGRRTFVQLPVRLANPPLHSTTHRSLPLSWHFAQNLNASRLLRVDGGTNGLVA